MTPRPRLQLEAAGEGAAEGAERLAVLVAEQGQALGGAALLLAGELEPGAVVELDRVELVEADGAGLGGLAVDPDRALGVARWDRSRPRRGSSRSSGRRGCGRRPLTSSRRCGGGGSRPTRPRRRGRRAPTRGRRPGRGSGSGRRSACGSRRRRRRRPGRSTRPSGPRRRGAGPGRRPCATWSTRPESWARPRFGAGPPLGRCRKTSPRAPGRAQAGVLVDLAALAVDDRPEGLAERADLDARGADTEGLGEGGDVAPLLAEGAARSERHLAAAGAGGPGGRRPGRARGAVRADPRLLDYGEDVAAGHRGALGDLERR